MAGHTYLKDDYYISARPVLRIDRKHNEHSLYLAPGALFRVEAVIQARVDQICKILALSYPEVDHQLTKWLSPWTKGTAVIFEREVPRPPERELHLWMINATNLMEDTFRKTSPLEVLATVQDG